MTAALARRLTAYATTAGITLALAPEADAQIVYTDVEPNVTFECGGNSVFEPLDIDGDGPTDFSFRGSFSYGCKFVDFVLNRWPNAPSYNGGLENSYDGRGGSADLLTYRDAIGPVASRRRFDGRAWLARVDYYSTVYGAFPGRIGYLGFRFVAGDGELHYGWARFGVSRNAWAARLYDYAYEATPERTILAGDILSDILLAGALDQTTVPAEGGTLRYTFTAENATGADAPLDLWVEAGRRGRRLTVRRLGAGTLPAGATASLTVPVHVPPGAPANEYDVTFKLGDFASRTALVADQFVVTKEGGTSAAPVEEILVGAEVAGDLFTAGTEAVAVGTHALSAPAPNPSDGRTALTLAVAEAQAVRVAVYDALGREVAVLWDGPLAPGEAHRLVFEGARLPAGVYAVRAVGETFSDVRTFTLTR